MSERRAPVQCDSTWHNPRSRRPDGAPGTIEWSEHLEAWEAYARRYGRDQTAERLADRGGFSRGELRMFLGREPLTFEPFRKTPRTV